MEVIKRDHENTHDVASVRLGWKKFTLSKIEDLKYLFLNGVPSLPL